LNKPANKIGHPSVIDLAADHLKTGFQAVMAQKDAERESADISKP
jgi:hypothetical protein